MAAPGRYAPLSTPLNSSYAPTLHAHLARLSQVACPACRKELRFHTQSAGAGAGLTNCACGACGAIFRMRAPPAGQASGSRGAGTAASVSNEAIVSESQVVLAAVACLLLLTGLMQRMLMVLLVAGLCGTSSLRFVQG